jgi:DNA (cytosine-5)-methyltransferase 1
VERRYDRPVGVDLFAGAGGFSCGMHQAGFHVVAAVDSDAYAAMTYMTNLARPGVQVHFDTQERAADFNRKAAKAMGVELGEPVRLAPGQQGRIHDWPLAGSGWISHYASCDCPPGRHEGVGYDGEYNDYLAQIGARPPHPEGCEHFWVADARSVTGQEILDAIGLRPGDVDVVFGGPPCQGFSTANVNRDPGDVRNTLVFHYARLVLEINPKAMVMENVPGLATMLTPEGVPVLDALARVLADGGWSGYDALRKSLTYQSGAAALVRSDLASASRPRRQTGQSTAAEHAAASEQLNLFEAARPEPERRERGASLQVPPAHRAPYRQAPSAQSGRKQRR